MKNDKDANAAAILSAAYIIGSVALIKATGQTAKSFWLWIIWTLAVVLYVVIHDYILNLRSSVHEKIKAVCKAEMRFLEERKAFYAETEVKNGNDSRR